MPKRVIILGSTGSIGRSALEVAANLPGEFEIVGLAAGSRWERLAAQVEQYRPAVAVLADPVAAENLAARIRRSVCEHNGIGVEPSRPASVATRPDDIGGGPLPYGRGSDGTPQADLATGCRTAIWAGAEGLLRLVNEVDCDFVLSAIVGIAGLPATLAAVRRGLTVGLANKESLVVAGELLVEAAAKHGARLLPVDSEHSAIYQSLHSGRREEVESIFLTASGGPFRTWTLDQMRLATVEDAMQHPTWNMGPKITIDSATMMNKALEIVEAKWLFGIDPDRIEVVIHPESIIHSMVAFHDGSVVAQMGRPDMRTPIQYAMTYPRRLAGCGKRLDFSGLEQMRFEPPDVERFPALRLGHDVARAGGTAGAALNAANEAAVEAFRERRIGFLDIVPLVAEAVRRHAFEQHPNLETLMAVDARAREEVMQCCPVC